MIPEQFAILGVVISFLGAITYVKATLQGKTKPNRVTWFLWMLAPFIAFSAQVSQGVWYQALLTFIVGFDPLLVLIASFFNKNAEWKLTTFDYFCGALSILAIILWQVTKVGNIAIALSIAADLLAAVPTVVKAYKFPQTESYKIYLAGVLCATITLLTIKTWNFESTAFALYILLLNSSLVLMITVPRTKKA